MKSTKFKSLDVAITAITVALYVVLGNLFQPISFMGLQFRVAEIVVGMVIIFPIPGLVGNVIGVFFVNLFSPLGPIDLISVVVNIPALYCIILFRERKYLKFVGGILYSLIISLYVGIILDLVLGLPWYIMFVQVLISEIVLVTLGIVIFDYVGIKMNLT